MADTAALPATTNATHSLSSANEVAVASPPVTERLLSVDALRGFDMFWITGGDALILSFLALFPAPWAASLSLQWKHVEWEGFRFYDFIFPLFLFLVGCVLPYSLEKYRHKPRDVYLRIARRVLVLFFLGLLANGLLRFNWADLRVAGVLQRIALCYGFAALLYLHFNVRGLVAWLIGILLGYWAIMAWVPAPGGIAGDFTIEGNLAGYLDRNFLPGKIKKAHYGFGDNEGLLTTLPAVGTALMGVLAGYWLKSSTAQWTKVSGLLMAGTASLFLGLAWSNAFPIIKILWTSSYVLVAGGCSLIILAWFYAVIDVIGWRKWAFFWVVIGTNAITIYVAQRFIDFRGMADFFLGGTASAGDLWWPGLAKLVLSVGTIACQWLFLWFLYRQRIFLRV